MVQPNTENHPQSGSQTRVVAVLQGVLAITPLTLAVLPWALLTGSMAVEAGLPPLQSLGMSAILYAGAAQLAIIGLLKTGAGLGAILATTALVSSRHLLYALSMRPALSPLPGRWRLLLGFLLTDELFAIIHPGHSRPFNRWYALGAGLCFYLGWNLASLAGILASHRIDNLDALGLDFAMAATFVALVVPTLTRRSTWACVAAALTLSALGGVMQWQYGLLLATLAGMTAGALCANLSGEVSR